MPSAIQQLFPKSLELAKSIYAFLAFHLDSLHLLALQGLSLENFQKLQWKQNVRGSLLSTAKSRDYMPVLSNMHKFSDTNQSVSIKVQLQIKQIICILCNFF